MKRSVAMVTRQFVSWKMLWMIAMVVMIPACAPIAMRPTQLVVSAEPMPDRTLTAMAPAHSSAGFDAHLPAGTILRSVGNIPEGSVWRPLNRTLAARGYDVHEGWVVLNGQTWIGFYHPVERTFSSLSHPIIIATEDRPR